MTKMFDMAEDGGSFIEYSALNGAELMRDLKTLAHDGKHYWPLYEAKKINIYDHLWKTPGKTVVAAAGGCYELDTYPAYCDLASVLQNCVDVWLVDDLNAMFCLFCVLLRWSIHDGSIGFRAHPRP